MYLSVHVYLLLKRSTQKRTADRLMATTLHVRDINIVRVDGVERLLFPFDAPLPTPLIRPTLQARFVETYFGQHTSI